MPNESLLEWSEYGNGTHNLTRAVNKEAIDCSVGVNGRIQASWNTTKPGDVRQIITPESVIELHFNEDNTVTISGCTDNYKVRSMNISRLPPI